MVVFVHTHAFTKSLSHVCTHTNIDTHKHTYTNTLLSDALRITQTTQVELTTLQTTNHNQKGGESVMENQNHFVLGVMLFISQNCLSVFSFVTTGSHFGCCIVFGRFQSPLERDCLVFILLVGQVPDFIMLTCLSSWPTFKAGLLCCVLFPAPVYHQRWSASKHPGWILHLDTYPSRPKS